MWENFHWLQPVAVVAIIVCVYYAFFKDWE